MEEIKNILRNKLNDEQFPAAVHTESSSLILAGAGSGKTRTLIYKLAYLHFGMGIDFSNIFAVTFTNKASREMKERLHELKDEMGYNGKLDEHNLWIGTFHGLFLRMLKQIVRKENFFGYEGEISVIDDGESQTVMRAVLKNLDMENDVELKEAKGFISGLKNKGIDSDKFQSMANGDYEATMAMIYKKYDGELKKSKVLDFDDLLLLPYKIFKHFPDVLAKWSDKFKYVLVDEAQDTNNIQFDLIKMLTSVHKNVTFIGDDYQSIYRWRGAVMENFLNVKSYWPDLQIFKLQTNYRSSHHIVEVGNSIIGNNSKQFDKKLVAHSKTNGQVMVFNHATDREEAMTIAKMIKDLIKSNGNNRSDYAILYRTNSQSAIFEEIFLYENIPFKIFGGFKFFDRKEIKDILAYMKCFVNKSDDISFKRIINVPKRKIGAESVNKLEAFVNSKGISMMDLVTNIDNYSIDLSKAVKNSLSDLGKIFEFFENSWGDKTPDMMIEELVNKIGYKNYLIQTDGEQEGLAKLENIGQLINIASRYTDAGMAGLLSFMDEVSLMTDTDGGENTDDNVKMMTIHTSKGLEFPYVFIVGLEDGIFPLARTKMVLEELEEERRLMYVGVTRAKAHLFLSHANMRRQRGQTKYNSPSQFIDEIPESYKKHYDFTNSKNTTITTSSFEIGDNVIHKLFGEGVIHEIRDDIAFVDFGKYKFRKVELRFLQKK